MTSPGVVKRLADKVVLITGGSRGIGAATCAVCADEGALVMTSHRSNAPTDVESVQADLRIQADVDRLIAATIERHGRIDVLVNNAGITRDNLVGMMTDEEWADVLDTNVTAAFRVARAVIKPMMLARKGRIINVSSVAATRPGRGQANYAASKAALEGFTKSLAVELAPRNITVNAVAPGVIDTSMTERIRQQAPDEIKRRIALGRVGTAREVANVIAFIASDAASYITGAVIPVDGGFKLK